MDSVLTFNTLILERKTSGLLENMYAWFDKKVQVGIDQEKAQSERNSHSKNRGGKN